MKLPRILQQERNGNVARVMLVAPATLTYFRGHFPRFPVLPGVVQIGWAATLAAQVFERRVTVSGMRRVKFMRLVRPERRILLELELHGECRLEFRYRYADANGDGSDAGRDLSSGSLQLEAA